MPLAPPTQSGATSLSVQLHTSSQSRFLSLPSELRSLICQYVLTSPHEIYMVLDRDDHPSEIFENPNGIIIPDEFSDLEVFNQVKYTCRQLYKETAGTEVQYNSIRIVSILKGAESCDVSTSDEKAQILFSTSVKSAEGFINFFQNCSLRKAAWFKDVFLGPIHPSYPFFDCTWIDHQPEDRPLERKVRLPDYFMAVARYCRDHPCMRVNVAVAGWGRWKYSSTWHIQYGLFLTQLYGGKDLRSEVVLNVEEIPDEWEYLFDMTEWCLDSDCAFIVGLSNLRFWPHNKILDETKFRKDLDESKWFDIDASLKLAKRWMAHGLLDYT
jgi:hypothetical protein